MSLQWGASSFLFFFFEKVAVVRGKRTIPNYEMEEKKESKKKKEMEEVGGGRDKEGQGGQTEKEEEERRRRRRERKGKVGFSMEFWGHFESDVGY